MESLTHGVCPESPAGHHCSCLCLCTLIRLTNAPAVRQPESNCRVICKFPTPEKKDIVFWEAGEQNAPAGRESEMEKRAEYL